jgi:hypothetical protein
MLNEKKNDKTKDDNLCFCALLMVLVSLSKCSDISLIPKKELLRLTITLEHIDRKCPLVSLTKYSICKSAVIIVLPV